MNAVISRMWFASPPLRNRAARDVVRKAWLPPLLCAAVSALCFAMARPSVGDLWAARAHESAAAHGVEAEYWFAWFGGATPPGGYSLLTPYLSALVGSAVLGAVATVSVTPLCHRLVLGCAHPVAATWTATVTAGVSLWSGRIPFALGTAISLAALLAVRGDRRVAATVCGALTALTSPVSAVFLMFGLVGVVVLQRGYRIPAGAGITGAGLVLALIAWNFGSPGPEPFSASQGRAVALSLALLLLARPAMHVAGVVVLSIAVCPILVAVPNGLGSNFERLSWVCLPAAVVATARVRASVAALAIAAASYYGITGTVRDLQIAVSPVSSAARYTALTERLDQTPGLASYRVEVVPDGTHTAAYVLLQHATLARGYETQADEALNALLMRPDLTAGQYRSWLNTNSVGYVVLDRKDLTTNPESQLVANGLRYLHQIWSDANWRLFKVGGAQPIVAAPARITDADQSNLVIRIAAAGPVTVRVRWSPYLSLHTLTRGGRATLHPGAHGSTVLDARTPGSYELEA